MKKKYSLFCFIRLMHIVLMPSVLWAIAPEKLKSRADFHSAQLKIVSWNLETFFDAHNDGIEYSQFQKNGKWGKEAYEQRLERLCKVIKTLDADVFVMEEIENPDILYDISNRMNSWRQNKSYKWACFAKEKKGSIGCAVLSRVLISDLKTHSLNIDTENYHQPSLRPILELTLHSKGRRLTLFVNHWKSMSGGEEKTEIWRKWQESILGNCIDICFENNFIACKIQKKSQIVVNNTDAAVLPADDGESANHAVIACGDFNKNIQNFTICDKLEKAENVNVFINYLKFRKMPAGYEGITNGKTAVYSPWILPDGSIISEGSYYFKGKWNYLDHFFSCGTAKIKCFTTEKNGPWANQNGIPMGYKMNAGTGYSDHLPISCIVEF